MVGFSTALKLHAVISIVPSGCDKGTFSDKPNQFLSGFKVMPHAKKNFLAFISSTT